VAVVVGRRRRWRRWKRWGGERSVMASIFFGGHRHDKKDWKKVDVDAR
jgi:hypothetical protein